MGAGSRATPGRLQDVGGRTAPGASSRAVTEVERPRTNIGHIRVKMSGTYFPDKVESVESSLERRPR